MQVASISNTPIMQSYLSSARVMRSELRDPKARRKSGLLSPRSPDSTMALSPRPHTFHSIAATGVLDADTLESAMINGECRAGMSELALVDVKVLHS